MNVAVGGAIASTRLVTCELCSVKTQDRELRHSTHVSSPGWHAHELFLLLSWSSMHLCRL